MEGRRYVICLPSHTLSSPLVQIHALQLLTVSHEYANDAQL